MKKTISVILIICILFAFSACAKKEKINEVNSASDLAQYSISINLPEGASGEKYALVESSNKGEKINIGQVTYDYNGISCTFRTANIAQYNVSGYDENKAQSEQSYDLNLANYNSKIRIMKVEGSTYVALWDLGDHSYSLKADATDDTSFTAVAMDAAQANIPTP